MDSIASILSWKIQTSLFADTWCISFRDTLWHTRPLKTFNIASRSRVYPKLLQTGQKLFFLLNLSDWLSSLVLWCRPSQGGQVMWPLGLRTSHLEPSLKMGTTTYQSRGNTVLQISRWHYRVSTKIAQQHSEPQGTWMSSTPGDLHQWVF